MSSLLLVLFIALALGSLLASGWMSIAVFSGVMLLYLFLCWVMEIPLVKK